MQSIYFFFRSFSIGRLFLFSIGGYKFVAFSIGTRFRKFFRVEFAKYGNRKKRNSVGKKLKNMCLPYFFFQIYWTICKGLQVFMARDRLQFLVSGASHKYTVCSNKIDKSWGKKMGRERKVGKMRKIASKWNAFFLMSEGGVEYVIECATIFSQWQNWLRCWCATNMAGDWYEFYSPQCRWNRNYAVQYDFGDVWILNIHISKIKIYLLYSRLLLGLITLVDNRYKFIRFFFWFFFVIGYLSMLYRLGIKILRNMKLNLIELQMIFLISC